MCAACCHWYSCCPLAVASPHQLSTSPTACSRPQRYNWMVFNDFHITPSMPDEVAELYGGQKAPCLLFYTQASKEGGMHFMRHPGIHNRLTEHRVCLQQDEVLNRGAWHVSWQRWPKVATTTHRCTSSAPLLQVEVVRQAAEVPPAQPVPVLSPEGFVALCRMPPLQVSGPGSCCRPLPSAFCFEGQYQTAAHAHLCDGEALAVCPQDAGAQLRRPAHASDCPPLRSARPLLLRAPRCDCTSPPLCRCRERSCRSPAACLLLTRSLWPTRRRRRRCSGGAVRTSCLQQQVSAGVLSAHPGGEGFSGRRAALLPALGAPAAHLAGA